MRAPTTILKQYLHIIQFAPSTLLWIHPRNKTFNAIYRPYMLFADRKYMYMHTYPDTLLITRNTAIEKKAKWVCIFLCQRLWPCPCTMCNEDILKYNYSLLLPFRWEQVCMSFHYRTYVHFGGNMQSWPNVDNSKHNVGTLWDRCCWLVSFNWLYIKF